MIPFADLYPALNTTNISGFMAYPNEVTGGWFWRLIMLTSYFIIFLYVKNRGYPMSRAFALTSFINFILVGILSFLGLMTGLDIFVAILFLGVGILGILKD